MGWVGWVAAYSITLLALLEPGWLAGWVVDDDARKLAALEETRTLTGCDRIDGVNPTPSHPATRLRDAAR
jgi:hypothetical protein